MIKDIIKESLNGNNILKPNLWIRLFAVILYIDIFSSITKFSADFNFVSFLSKLDLSVIILFTVGAISAIVIVSAISIILYTTYMFTFHKLFKSERNNNDISIQSLKEYALKYNNQVAYDIASNAEKIRNSKEANQKIYVCTLVLLGLNIYYGSLTEKFHITAPFDIFCSYVLILISIGLLFHFILKFNTDDIYLSSDLRKTIRNSTKKINKE